MTDTGWKPVLQRRRMVSARLKGAGRRWVLSLTNGSDAIEETYEAQDTMGLQLSIPFRGRRLMYNRRGMPSLLRGQNQPGVIKT